MKTIEIPSEFKRLFDTDWREAAVHGGRYSLKSHTVARVLLIKARQAKIRVACFREFQNSIADSSHQLLADLIKLYELGDFVVTDKAIINTITGSDFIFKGLYHNEQNIKSTEGIDIAWVEEAQTVSKKSLEVLTPTVRKPGSQIIYTYNRLLEDDPVHTRLIVEGRPNTLIINVNYDIAIKYKMMPDNILNEINDDKEKRPALYKHKWLGQPNTLEKKIYKDWAIIDSIPHEARLERYGLDFGYSNDPTAIVAVYYYNGGYIVDEITYQKGLLNKPIADILINQPSALTIGDSSEPKSIAEVKLYGVNITGAKKMKERASPMKTYNQWAISVVQEQRISMTRRSINIIKEYNNYMFQEDKDGKILNDPEDLWNHTMDAIKYAIISLAPVKKKAELRRRIGINYQRSLKRKQNVAV
jgi:phage terminase large subunit